MNFHENYLTLRDLFRDLFEDPGISYYKFLINTTHMNFQETAGDLLQHFKCWVFIASSIHCRFDFLLLFWTQKCFNDFCLSAFSPVIFYFILNIVSFLSKQTTFILTLSCLGHSKVNILSRKRLSISLVLSLAESLCYRQFETGWILRLPADISIHLLEQTQP